MSSLNIDELYETINEKNNQRVKKFDGILKQIHARIKYYAKLERTFCFFQIPEFIIGVPLYNIDELKMYLINSLKKDGFKLLYIDPNWLFISWEYKKNKKPINKKVTREKVNYKLIDEYKPIGGFYDEHDLSFIKDKTNNMF